MGQFFQMAKAKEAAGSLDGVDGAENAGQRIPIIRILLEHDEFSVEQIQTFQAFSQEFFKDVIHSQ